MLKIMKTKGKKVIFSCHLSPEANALTLRPFANSGELQLISDAAWTGSQLCRMGQKNLATLLRLLSDEDLRGLSIVMHSIFKFNLENSGYLAFDKALKAEAATRFL